MRVVPILAFLFVAALGASCRAAAQAGALAGRVLTGQGEPVPQALVTLAPPAGPAVSTRSGADGRFVLAFPPGSGACELSVRRLGFVTARFEIARPGAGGAGVREVRLAAQPTLLAAVQARASRAPLSEPPGGTGATATALQFSLVDWTAVDPSDLGAVAAAHAGVVPVGAGDGATAVSILGQAPSATRTTLDGAGFGAGGLPQEAIRKVGVVVTAYDVSRGQFTGGQVTATTHTGSNDPGASLSVRLRGPPLRWAGAPVAPLAETGWMQGSGGAGGALLRDRVFAFAAAQWSHRSAASPLEPGGGLAADSLVRVMEVLRQSGAPTPAPAARAGSDAGSAIARLDAVLSPAHHAAVRLDGHWSRDGDPASLGLAGTGGRRTARAAGVLGSLVSRAGGWSNELHAYRSEGDQRAEPDGAGPAGEVWLGGSGGTLRFGAGTLASSTRRSLLDVGDALSLRLGGNTHRVQAGVAFVAERARVDERTNAAGTFVFGSLADLAAGTPARFTRTLASVPGTADTRYAAVYAGHALQLNRLTLSYGVRADALWYGAPGAAAAADPVTGRVPGRIPARATLSPRLAFGYDFRNAHGWSVGTVRGGVGRFVGRAQADELAPVMGETGAARVELVCVGAAAPRPAWSAYAGDPSAVPLACRDGAGAFASRAARTSVFAPSYTAPRAWHASLYTQWQPVARWAVNAEAVLVRGDGGAVAFDRNLAAAPAFALAAEGGRPVYAPPLAIDPATGGVAFAASRRTPELGVAREIGSGRTRTRQLMLGAFAVLERSTIANASYLWTDSRDAAGPLEGPGGAQPLAAGAPGAPLEGPADFERRHHVQLSLTRPFGSHLRLSLLGRATSGAPYTPRVQGDVNGDGAWNDAAFVFAPGDPAAPAGFSRLLASLPGGARACLARQAGRVAGRNQCRGPWLASLDAQAQLVPGPRPAAEPRMRISLLASNLPGLADYVMHGAARLRGWGQPAVPDPVLLRVTGFDAARRAWVYEPNPGFGRSLTSRLGTRAAFTLTLQARVTVGDDPGRHWMTETRRAAFRYARPPAELARRISEQLVDLPVRVLEHDDSLRLSLSPAQRGALGGLADSLHVRLIPLIDALARTASAADTVPTPSAPVRTEVRAQSAEVYDVLAAVAERVRAVLTAEQWERLPPGWRTVDRGRPVVPMKPLITENEEP